MNSSELTGAMARVQGTGGYERVLHRLERDSETRRKDLDCAQNDDKRRCELLNVAHWRTAHGRRRQKALYFPDIVGTNLRSQHNVHTTGLCMGKVSVVAMLTTRVSEVRSLYLPDECKSTHSQLSYKSPITSSRLTRSILRILCTATSR